MPAVSEEQNEVANVKVNKSETKEETQGATNGEEAEKRKEENGKLKRPSTAELLHLKEIVEKGEFAGPTIVESVKYEKDVEKEAFENLLKENVKLERELKAAEAKLAQVKHNYDVKFVELDSQKDQTDDLKAQVKHLERQVEKYKRRKHYEDNEKDGEELVIADELEMKETVRDLQLRLTRMTGDSEMKDLRIYELEKELKIERMVCQDLQRHIGENGEKKAEESRKKHEHESEYEKKNHTPDQKHNVVPARNTQSKVCIVM